MIERDLKLLEIAFLPHTAGAASISDGVTYQIVMGFFVSFSESLLSFQVHKRNDSK